MHGDLARTVTAILAEPEVTVLAHQSANAQLLVRPHGAHLNFDQWGRVLLRHASVSTTEARLFSPVFPNSALLPLWKGFEKLWT